ncbi:C3 and PZP-like alpha-2-macroglobulin domain-containing protein 8 [Ischnura elegans]|uniref:C3 and PZP-like alpha-2-macroglobulin domain-containing protein 8 n=1 Tax=Ischnura elegans TaxID=197161 RepID=UPI001ED8722C|nr:C3 and PZP-like alpha-2-macroglobulin domain-containing protein 8 [Ischnura elegans]
MAPEVEKRRHGRFQSWSLAFAVQMILMVALPMACPAQADDECSHGLSVISPNVAVPGKPTAVLVTIHKVTPPLGGPANENSTSSSTTPATPPDIWMQTGGPVNVTVSLLQIPPAGEPHPRTHKGQQRQYQVLAEVTKKIYANGIITLPIPADTRPGQWCILHVRADCSADGAKKPTNSTLESLSNLRLVGRVRDVIVRPAKSYYNPGETIIFWVLALDHDLRVPTSVLGRITVHDPIGNSVTVWEEVPLDEGVKTFSLPLSHAARTGRWTIRVDVGEPAESFSSTINVTLEDGPGETSEVAMAEEHFVELRFGTEMRRLYKPGLPFVGKVEAVSTENSVRVRVKVYDNTTAIYSQDIEITSGEGTFVVPAILADSEVIILQAELVSVEGKEIDSHYVLAREPIRKWNSSSDCYIIIEGMEQTMEPGELAKAAILSTCPCDKNFQMVVTTNGQVNYWTERHVETGKWRRGSSVSEEEGGGDEGDGNATILNLEGSAMCRVYFSFTVQAVMAPVSHLLVYYITEDGEPISDVVSFDINLHQKQVTLEHDEPKDLWLVSEDMEVRVSAAEAGALVCLIGGRAASDGKDEGEMGGGSREDKGRKRFGAARISPKKTTVAAEEGTGASGEGRAGGPKGEGKLVPAEEPDESRVPATANPDMDFEEAGIGYARTRCSVRPPNFWEAAMEAARKAAGGEWPRKEDSAEGKAGGSGISKRLQQRLLEGVVRGAGLEQLWVWKCFNYSSEASPSLGIGGRSGGLSVRLSAPPDAGKWALRAVALSRRWGVRVSPPLPVPAFRPLATHFRLPSSLRVGEALEVDVKIVNNINSCLDITAHLALTEGAHFLSNRVLYLTEKLRLGPHGATSLVVKVVVTRPGLKNMTAEVSGFRSDNCRAAGGSDGAVAAPYGNETLVVTAVRSAAMLVHPEGIVKTTTESAYFCANENVLISSPDTFRFEWVGAPRSREGVVFEVRAGAGVHVALSDVREASSSMYRVALGDADNTVSWIGRGSHAIGVHLASAQTPRILSSEDFRTFWMTWEQRSGRLEVGTGHTFHNGTILSVKTDPSHRVRQLGFASDWGLPAEFRVWNFNDEAGFSQVLHLDVPKSVVPGTEQGSLFVAGGLFLPPHRDTSRTSAVPQDDDEEGILPPWGGGGDSGSGGRGGGSGGEDEGGEGRASRAEEDEGGEEEEEAGPGVGGDEEWEWEGGPPSAGPDLSDALAAFAPLLRLEHQEAVGEASAARRQRVRRLLGLRVQVLLGFRNVEEGFFGDHPRIPHYGNTLLAMEVLTKAQAYISIDPEILLSAKRWIHSRQLEDGSFTASPRDGSVVTAVNNITSPETLRAFNWAVEITSETIYTLLEVNIESESDSEVILKARGFLERSIPHATTPRAVAALSMALSLSRSPSAAAALDKLRAASTDDEGDFEWATAPAAPQAPEDESSAARGQRAGPTPDWLYEEGEEAAEENDPNAPSGTMPGPSVDEFVASMFALRTHTARGDLQSAEPVARFLFYRSQLLDTHRELVYPSARAFLSFATLAADSHRSLTVSLATSGMELTDTIELGPSPPPKTRLRPSPPPRAALRPRAHLLHLPSLPTKVFIYATGAGCASVSGRVTYSTYAPPPPGPRLPPLRLWARVDVEDDPRPNSIDELQGKLPLVQVRACFRWQGEGASGVLRLEVSLFSGFEVEHVAPIRGPNGKNVDFLHDKRGEKIWFLFDSVLPGCALCARFTARGRYSVRSLRPASARVFPAGRAHLAAHAFFHAPRRNQSALLAGVTDDDLITWFGKQVVESAGAAEVPLGSDFSDMCECDCQPCSGGVKGEAAATGADKNSTESPKPTSESTPTQAPVKLTTTTFATTPKAATHPPTVTAVPTRVTTQGENIEKLADILTPKPDAVKQPNEESETTTRAPKILSRNRNREVYKTVPENSDGLHQEDNADHDIVNNVVVSLETPSVKPNTKPENASPVTDNVTSPPTRSQPIIAISTTGPQTTTNQNISPLTRIPETSKNATTLHRKETPREMGTTTLGTEPPGTVTVSESPEVTQMGKKASSAISKEVTTAAETSTAAATSTVDPATVRTGSTAKKWPRVRLPDMKTKPTPISQSNLKQTEGRMVVLDGNSLYGLLKGSAKPDPHGRPIKGKGQDD